MAKEKPISLNQAFRAFRKKKRGHNADAVLVVRGTLDQHGNWEVDWEAAHWMPDLPDHCVAPSGLPAGFGTAAAQEIATVSAGDVAEERLGKLGSALGKGAWEFVSDKLSGKYEKEQ